MVVTVDSRHHTLLLLMMMMAAVVVVVKASFLEWQSAVCNHIHCLTDITTSPAIIIIITSSIMTLVTRPSDIPLVHAVRAVR